jgi:uncharacterized protein YjbI with pentapeptide repeats
MQAYLDNMSTLLIDEHGTQLRKLDPDAEVLDLLQARTETVFAILDRQRQVSIVQFLARAQLILKDSPIVTLERVNLEGVDLTGLNLSNTSFEATSLAHAELPEANLKGANFTGADLFDANLTGAKLKGAVFTDARLAEAMVTAEQLHTAHSLENALMPDGQVYEDWLKDHPVPPPDTDNDGATRQNGTGQFPKKTFARSHHRDRKNESKKDCGQTGENSDSSQRLPDQTSEKPDKAKFAFWKFLEGQMQDHA